jgi:hypothetical protein
MSPFTISTLILIAPWGIYFLIKRIILLSFEDIISSIRSGKNLDVTLKRKFDTAYDNNNADEIVRVEEDVMYARLEALSKPRINRETRRMQINYIIEWTAKNNYPGTKRQIDLLINAISANQKYPEVLSQLSSHLNTVSSNLERNENKKNKKFRKINNFEKETFSTPSIVSIWLTIVVYCAFVYIANLIDELSLIAQIFFWGLTILALYLSLGRLNVKSPFLKIFLALALSTMYLYAYSYWHHMKADPNYFHLEGTDIEIQYPHWLTADDLSARNDKCDKELTIRGNTTFSSITIEYPNKEIEVLDSECKLPILADPIVVNSSSSFHLRPKNLGSLSKRENTAITPTWFNPKTQQNQKIDLSINFENLVWYYGRQAWIVGLAGIVGVLLVDYLRSKLKTTGE